MTNPNCKMKAQAPEFTADAPGFDMLADADADNEVENGVAPISGDDGSYKVLARKYRRAILTISLAKKPWCKP